MSEIKSLADKLKHKLSQEKQAAEFSIPQPREPESIPIKEIPKAEEKRITQFISSLEKFKMDGQEKILIRIDKRTMLTLRRLKLATGIDMTRLIVFALSQFLKSHHWLNDFIAYTLKKNEP